MAQTAFPRGQTGRSIVRMRNRLGLSSTCSSCIYQNYEDNMSVGYQRGEKRGEGTYKASTGTGGKGEDLFVVERRWVLVGCEVELRAVNLNVVISRQDRLWCAGDSRMLGISH